jgi:two-component system response regulator HydG
MSEAGPLPTVLVVDDKANMVTLLAKVLQRDARVLKATSGAAAIQLITENEVDAVVCDLRMPDLDGLAVLDAVRRIRPNAQFVLMTAFGSVQSAIDAMKRGAFDYVTKPFEPDQLRAIVLRALGRPSTPTGEIAAFDPLPGMVGSSLAMAEVARVVRRVANSDVNVLVLGETGTGKELVARALHALGPRAAAPFVRVGCGSIPSDALEGELFGSTGGGRDRPGLFEQAEAGTLFLDEIGEIRLALQAKLTRVLEERRVRRIGDARDRPMNARIVAATHRDVEALAREGSMREDLLYRLRVATITLPPLRERGGDVAALTAHFLSELPPRSDGTRANAIAPAALLLLERYRWPGNVHELRAAIASAALVAKGDRIEAGDLPAETRVGAGSGPIDLASMSYQQALEAAREDATRRYLEAVLRRTKGKVAQAAEIAGIERESFYRLLRRYAVSPDDFRGD